VEEQHQFGFSSDNIDKNVPIPYHYQLRELIRDEITTGRLGVGDRLPSERELCIIFKLSRTPVREAIDALVKEGLLIRQKGRGTFVAEPKIMERWLESPEGFTDSISEQGFQVQTRVRTFALVPAPHKVAIELRLSSNEPVIILDRVRSILNEPILLVTSYLPEKICPTLFEHDLSSNSLYQILREKYNIHIAGAKRCLEAVIANESESELLNISPGAPLMLIESTSYLEDGTAVEYFKARHRGDRTRFQVNSLHHVISHPNS
jgi:GntR family transcriptional regulator